MKRKVGFLLALPPSHGSALTVHKLVEATLEAGHEVYLYLIDEGVKNLHTDYYQGLAHAGAKVFVCAYGCHQHQVSTAEVPSSISFCGLVVLSGIVDSCEPFLSFT